MKMLSKILIIACFILLGSLGIIAGVFIESDNAVSSICAQNTSNQLNTIQTSSEKTTNIKSNTQKPKKGKLCPNCGKYGLHQIDKYWNEIAGEYEIMYKCSYCGYTAPGLESWG